MKILNVLINESVAALYRDLTDMQSIVLMRIADGKTSYDTASEREQGIMDELADLGLVDFPAYELNMKGQMVASMAQKYGPRDARMMAKRKAAAGIKPVQGDGRYTDVGDVSDNIEGDAVAGMTGRGLGIGGRPNRDNSI